MPDELEQAEIDRKAKVAKNKIINPVFASVGNLCDINTELIKAAKTKLPDCAYCGNKPGIGIAEAQMIIKGKFCHIICGCEQSAAAQKALDSLEKLEQHKKSIRSTFPARYEHASLSDFSGDFVQVVKTGLNDKSGYVLHSDRSGNGKTHLAYAIALEISSLRFVVGNKKNDVGCIYLQGLTQDLFDKTADINKIKNIGVLIIDDLAIQKDQSAMNTNYISKLFDIINYRYNNFLPTIITTNRSEEKLFRDVTQKVFSRIKGMCTFVELKGEDRRPGELQKILDNNPKIS